MAVRNQQKSGLFATINRRFEFCASHRYGIAEWSHQKNLENFGSGTNGRFGHGHNYAAHFVLNGPVNPDTGLIMNLDEVKKRISPIIDSRYDHKFLNVDTPPFDQIQPSPENLALTLLKEIQPLFESSTVQPFACHLRESHARGATAYVNGDIESVFVLPLSVTIGTLGEFPVLKLIITLKEKLGQETGMIRPEAAVLSWLNELLLSYSEQLQAINSNQKTLDLLELAGALWADIESGLPLARIRLANKGHLFVESRGRDDFHLGVLTSFYAAHRLHNPVFSNQKNDQLYGVCGNPNGHGHQFGLECSLARRRKKAERLNSDDFGPLKRKLSDIIETWNHRRLDLEVPEFRDIQTTGENLLKVVWDKLIPDMGDSLSRLRLFETANNRFALRRVIQFQSDQ